MLPQFCHISVFVCHIFLLVLLKDFRIYIFSMNGRPPVLNIQTKFAFLALILGRHFAVPMIFYKMLKDCSFICVLISINVLTHFGNFFNTTRSLK